MAKIVVSLLGLLHLLKTTEMAIGIQRFLIGVVAACSRGFSSNSAVHSIPPHCKNVYLQPRPSIFYILHQSIASSNIFVDGQLPSK